MEELEINDWLIRENLFELFRQQLKKDFEGAGADAGFTETLPQEMDALKKCVMVALAPLMRSGILQGLLYRIDISEAQLKKYQQASPALPFEELLAELIIKRILQKVILKKKFS